ncbi:hypothetical protein E2C01_060324 [Portunus trituberculatus]|uniref:Uncharacterized protein n=1 Tax=Portunus trituberculatus TaxID=210409 RepID=A0A5B7HB32_PORTR|nr:hypothetical protein [Portunus trituberculatus]
MNKALPDAAIRLYHEELGRWDTRGAKGQEISVLNQVLKSYDTTDKKLMSNATGGRDASYNSNRLVLGWIK